MTDAAGHIEPGWIGVFKLAKQVGVEVDGITRALADLLMDAHPVVAIHHVNQRGHAVWVVCDIRRDKVAAAEPLVAPRSLRPIQIIHDADDPVTDTPSRSFEMWTTAMPMFGW